MEGPDRSGDGELQEHATGLRPVDGSRIRLRHDAENHGHTKDRGRDNVPGPKRYGRIHPSTCLVLQSRVDYHYGEEKREIWACHLEHSPCVRLSRLVENPETSGLNRKPAELRNRALD